MTMELSASRDTNKIMSDKPMGLSDIDLKPVSNDMPSPLITGTDKPAITEFNEGFGEFQLDTGAAVTYDKYKECYSYQFRQQLDGNPLTTLAELFDIGDWLRDNIQQMQEYEAYALQDLKLTFQYPANALKVAFGGVLAFIRDPLRTDIPDSGAYRHVDPIGPNQRYEDMKIISFGTNFSWQVPVPTNYFYTLVGQDKRFSSPGQIYYDAMRTDAQHSSMVLTLQGTVSFKCPTITSGYLATVAYLDNVVQSTNDQAQAEVTVRDRGVILSLVSPTQIDLGEDYGDTVAAFLQRPLRITFQVARAPLDPNLPQDTVAAHAVVQKILYRQVGTTTYHGYIDVSELYQLNLDTEQPQTTIFDMHHSPGLLYSSISATLDFPALLDSEILNK